jgi:hypothetical protein
MLGHVGQTQHATEGFQAVPFHHSVVVSLEIESTSGLDDFTDLMLNANVNVLINISANINPEIVFLNNIIPSPF